jgi:hypothetical protein
MGLTVAVGSFAANTTATQQAVVVGFQPAVVLFYGTADTADGTSAHMIGGLGVGVSVTDERSIAVRSRDARADGAPARRQTTGVCYGLITSNATTVLRECEYLGTDDVSGGRFLVNWTTAHTSAHIVNYLAIGGSDLTHVATGADTAPTTATAKATTGLGFQPDCVLLCGVRTTSESVLQAATTNVALGVMTADSQACHVTRHRDGSALADIISMQQTDKCLTYLVDNTDGVAEQAERQSLDSDGFTLNWTTVSGSAMYFYWIALKGPQFKVVSHTQNTSTGTKQTTGVGFQPSGLLFGSFKQPADTSVVIADPGTWTLGAASGSSARSAIWLGDLNDATNTDTDSALTRSAVLQARAPGTATVVAEADLQSLDSDGFTLNWTTADATARQFWSLAIGAAVTPPSVVPVFVHHYRQQGFM